MEETIPRSNFSADVKLEMIVGERVFPLSHVGPEAVRLRQAVELDACEAVVVVTVDGRPHRRRVRLPQGALPFDEVVAVETCE